ncbi:MAG TPA: histidine kinase [Nitrospiraceae bacterium]|nr:histidine kinase [Nitrospiraceae bacterium]
MKRGAGSIKGRLFFWSLLITSAVLILLGISVYREIQKSILHSVANALHSKIQILKGLLHEEHGMIELELAEVVSGEYSVPRSGHYYKVILDGDVLAASPSLMEEDFDLDSGKLVSQDEALKEKVYISRGPAHEQIMVVRHDFLLFDTSAVVYAAQSLEESMQMINRFRTILFIAISLNIMVLAFAGFWIARRSLSPLARFSDRIEKITHMTMGERIDPEFQVDEVRNVARSFNDMLDRLQGAFESEKRLVADASHELKTPLSVIKAQCDVLLQRERTKEEYAGALSKIKGTSDTMKKLIDDMLSLTRLDSGSLSASGFADVSLGECINRAVKFTEFMAEAKQIQINKNISKDIWIKGDQNALTEIFLNIIENAIKYSPAENSIEITLTPDAREATVEITDHGAGITQEDMERVFDRFYRGTAARTLPGTGLGLSIAKAIAEAHGGRILARSEPGKGSSFFITLPLNDSHSG